MTGAGALPSIGLVTLTRDEGPLLRKWVDHHARVGMTNILVFDDGSRDGSTDDLPCSVHRLPAMPGGRGFEAGRLALINGVAEGLLAVYDYVAFCDVDEFLVPDPERFDSLPELLEARGRPDVIASTALDVVHVPGEGPLDLSLPVLSQRAFAKFAPVMCKPALKRIAADWARGSHGIRSPYGVDPDLFMIHLKFADRDRLAGIAAMRHEQHLVDGRAPKSGWSLKADEVVSILDQALRTFDPAVEEFDPHVLRLAELVEAHADGSYRSARGGMRKQPFVRVPAKLRAAL